MRRGEAALQTEGQEVQEEIQFANPNLEKTIRKAIRKPKGPILKLELEGLTGLLDASTVLNKNFLKVGDEHDFTRKDFNNFKTPGA